MAAAAVLLTAAAAAALVRCSQGGPVSSAPPPFRKLPRLAPSQGMERMEAERVEKERRLNRIGLSYKCKYCGLPKKGHVCTGKPAGDDVSVGAVKNPAGKAAKAKLASEKQRDNDEEERSEVWGAAAICADIKSVVSAARAEKGDDDEEERGEEWSAAAICADIKSVVSAAGAKKGGSKRARKDSEKLFDAVRPPPSIITPDDTRSSGLPLLGGPPSMLSSFVGPGSSSNLSPGTFMTTLGTPVPPLLTPELSPNTLDVMGGQVHRELRSTRRRQQELRRLASLP